MKSKRNMILFLSLLAFLSSCVERVGYYDNGEQGIIDNLIDKKWERNYEYMDPKGEKYTTYETYIFKKDGTCSSKFVHISQSGKTNEQTINSRWAFYTPNFSVLYFNSGIYWQIRKLTPTQLSVIETMGDYNNVGNTRYDKDFESKKE